MSLKRYYWFLIAQFSLQISVFSCPSYGASLKFDSVTWFADDTSIAIKTMQKNNVLLLPKKGGGYVTNVCITEQCTLILVNYLEKNGNMTFGESVLIEKSNVYGTINEGTGRIEISTTGELGGLFSSSTANVSLVESTGFEAEIGIPGDQLSQGGEISFSTRWFSDDVIGIDPITTDEIILGDFLLDSISSLTAFNYNFDSSVNLITSSFTQGEQYTFSSGQTINGEVSSNLYAEPVPIPNSAWLLVSGILVLMFRSNRKLRVYLYVAKDLRYL